VNEIELKSGWLNKGQPDSDKQVGFQKAILKRLAGAKEKDDFFLFTFS